jgi:hypothetical protein
MNMEQLVEWEVAGESQVLGGKLPQRRLFPPKIPLYPSYGAAEFFCMLMYGED